jgi:hypothetical protein
MDEKSIKGKGTVRRAGGQGFPHEGNPPASPARDDHDRWERGQGRCYPELSGGARSALAIRPGKSLNSAVEQDHCGGKRVARPLLGFKAFDPAQWILARLARMPMLQQGQLEGRAAQGLRPAAQFCSLAASLQVSRPSRVSIENLRQNVSRRCFLDNEIVPFPSSNPAIYAASAAVSVFTCL